MNNLNLKKIYFKKVSNSKNKIPLRQAKESFYGKNGAAISITKMDKIKYFVDGGLCYIWR